MSPQISFRHGLVRSLFASSLLFIGIAPVLHGEKTFDITFTSRDLEAGFSKGEGRALPGPDPVFEEDLVAHSAPLGLRLGGDAPEVRFRGAKNSPAGEGSVVLHIECDQWGPGEIPIFRMVRGGKTVLEIRKTGAATLLVTGATEDGTAFELRAASPLPAEAATLALSFTPESLSLHINGKKEGSIPLRGPIPAAEELIFGGASTPRGGKAAILVAATLRDDLEIAPDRTGDKAGLSGLAEGERFAGPATQWWQEGSPRLGLAARDPRYVPAPWEPVRHKEAAFEVWNRQYSFSGKEFLTQITAAKRPLLHAPATLLAKVNGEPHPVLFDAPELQEDLPGRVIFQRRAETPELAVTARYTIEYDGAVFIDLECSPGKEARLQGLSLELRFPEEAARFIQYIGAPKKYESQNLAWNSNSGAFPESSLELGFKTYLWVGDNNRGLQWFARSDENWWPLDRNNAIRLQRLPGGEAGVTVDFMTQPLPKPGAFRLSFGLMATPVKPMPERWREWTMSAQHKGQAEKARGRMVIYWPDEWRSMFLDPEPDRATAEKAAGVAKKVARDHAEGRLILPYWTRIHLPVRQEKIVNPDAAKMVEKWAAAPDHVRSGGLDIRRVSMESGWSDYLLWCFQRWGEKYGAIDGLYLDETQPIPNTRAESGGGYVAPNGERRATYEFSGSRDYIKRLNYLAEQRNGRPARTIVHNSATYAMPYMSGYSVFLTGEHLNSGYFTVSNKALLPSEEERKAGYYYCHVLPMDRLRAEGFYRQWGVPIAWLPQLKNHPDIMNSPVAARDLLSRLMQVDTLIWPLFINAAEAMKVQAFREAFGIGDDEVTFIPYWENAEITSDTPEVIIGYYRRPGRKLILVSNLNREGKRVDLRFREPLSGSIRDAETQETLLPTGNQLSFDVPRNDYRALLLSE